MTGGKLKSLLRSLEYNARKAALLQAASNYVDRQDVTKLVDEAAESSAVLGCRKQCRANFSLQKS